MQDSVSIVIPVYNEEGNVSNLHSEIVGVLEEENCKFEIIFIDDHSTDKTVEALKELKPAKIILFRKNFGQTQAMDAGIKAAKNDLIITMDGDGQNDPADIPAMIKLMHEKEYDVVSGWRKNRKDPLSKLIMTKVARFIRKFLIDDGIKDSGCSLKVYKRECFEDMTLYGEMHRFIPALLKIRGFRIGEMVVNHRPRIHGKSKYAWKRGFKGFIDMISVWYWKKYAVRPLHILGGLGMFIIFFGIICGIITIIEYVRGQDLTDTIWPLFTLFSIFIGAQIFITGLIADMLNKTYYENRDEVPYSILKVIENKGPN